MTRTLISTPDPEPQRPGMRVTACTGPYSYWVLNGYSTSGTPLIVTTSTNANTSIWIRP